MTYTTEQIDDLIGKYLNGGPMPKIFFRNNFGERKAGIKHLPSYSEMEEYSKCLTDIVYFANNYCKVLTPNGVNQIKLRDYQVKILRNYENNRFNTFVGSRQVGLSTLLDIIMLHELTFGTNKNIASVSHKRVISQESIKKIRDMYASLPFFLKPGIIEADLNFIKLENGNQIKGEGKKGNESKGMNIHRCFLLDFGYFPDDEAQSLFKSLLPQLASIKDTKLVLSSTGRSNDFLAKTIQDSEREETDPSKNSFHSQRVYWWEVPGRDDEWKETMIKHIGSQKDFDEEYNLLFLYRR
jgi:hypothetical protein